MSDTPSQVHDYHSDHVWWCEVQVAEGSRRPHRVRLMREWRGFPPRIQWIKSFRKREKADRLVERTMSDLAQRLAPGSWERARPQ